MSSTRLASSIMAERVVKLVDICPGYFNFHTKTMGLSSRGEPTLAPGENKHPQYELIMYVLGLLQQTGELRAEHSLNGSLTCDLELELGDVYWYAFAVGKLVDYHFELRLQASAETRAAQPNFTDSYMTLFARAAAISGILKKLLRTRGPASPWASQAFQSKKKKIHLHLSGIFRELLIVCELYGVPTARVLHSNRSKLIERYSPE